MKVKNLVVANIFYPTVISKTKEEYETKPDVILRKLDDDSYQNVENNTIYITTYMRGFQRVDLSSIIPLSDYYYRIGLKKRNKHENKEIIYQKIKKLKQHKIKLK